MTKKSNVKAKKYSVELVNENKCFTITVENLLKFSSGMKEHSDNTVKGLVESVKVAMKLSNSELSYKEYRSSYKTKKPKEIDKDVDKDIEKEKSIVAKNTSSNLKSRLVIRKNKKIAKDDDGSSSSYLTKSEISCSSDADFSSKSKENRKDHKDIELKARIRVREGVVKKKPYINNNTSNYNSKEFAVNDLTKRSNNRKKENNSEKKLNSDVTKIKETSTSKEKQRKSNEEKVKEKKIGITETSNKDESESDEKTNNENLQAEQLKKQRKLRLATLIESLIFIKVNGPASSGIKTIQSKLVEIKDLIDHLYQEPGLYQVRNFT
jgi:hypothetical protein